MRNSHHLCRKCDYKRKYGAQLEETTAPQPLSTLEQIGTNAVSLVQSLPVHSHHRAPLLHHLSQNITSTEAAAAFNTSASYIRECKRKNMSDSDLLTQKYSSDVKRQKFNDATINHAMNFIIDNCPTKSGSSIIQPRQYLNDAELYTNYLSSNPKEEITLVSLNTFMKYKK